MTLSTKAPDVVIVSADKERYQLWSEQFGDRAQTRWAESGRQMLAHAVEKTPALAILDDDLPDMTPLDLARQLIFTNALINVALVSEAPEERFHEATEGLGVVAQLPRVPDSHTVSRLLEALSAMGRV
jgi:DNA-binding response OmpR family regulator